MVKLLSADRALSLQAHPSKKQAEQGFTAQECTANAVGETSPNYVDVNHKPELLVALSHFDALVGFRPLALTLDLLDALGLLDVFGLAACDQEGPIRDEEMLRKAFVAVICAPKGELQVLLLRLKVASENYVRAHGAQGRWADVVSTALDLLAEYPGDAGVLASLLLNRVRLAPGEAVFVGPGQLHAYLRGIGVEVMAASDNVVRGGLTKKNVDINELLKVLSFSPLQEPRVTPIDRSWEGLSASDYPVPVSDFRVETLRLPVGGSSVLPCSDGPEIFLCTWGAVLVETAADSEVIHAGQAYWLSAAYRDVKLGSESGAVIFRVSIGA